MAAPAYSTDLTDISTAESLTNWAETTTWAAGAVPALEPDFFIQGANCIAKYMTSGGVGVGGVAYNFGSGVTIPSPGAFFVWINQQCPNNVDTLANGGIRALAGSGIGAFYGWALDGKDTLPYGGWKCYPVDPSTNVTRDYTVGAPSGVLQYFGIAVNQLANAKGGVGCDVIRYGRGQFKVLNGEAANYGTFTGAAAANDAIAARWGLCQAIPGGFLQQGLFLMGDATTAVDFRDSNTSVLIANTTKVVSAFNLFEVRNAASRVDWTSISFQALGIVSRGNFTITDNAAVNWTGCTFTDVGLFSLLGATTVLNSVFRRTDKITTGGATLTGCTFDNNRATTAVLASSPANAAKVTGCAFNSDGTGHGLEVTGTAANFTIDGNKFNGYAASNGSTGNEAVFINIATGNVEISLTNGSTTPSIRTAGATVTFAATSVTVKVTVKDALTGLPVQNAKVLLEKISDGADILLADTNASGIATTSFSYMGDTAVVGRARRATEALGTLYKPGAISGSITAAGFDVTVLLQPD